MSIFDNLIKSAQSLFKGAANQAVHNAKNEINQGINNAIWDAATTSSHTVTFESLPEDIESFKALPGADLKDPYAVAALTVVALCEFPKDKDTCVAMLNHLKGPRPMTFSEISFVSDRFMDGVDYIPRSYLKGTSPENDYTPSVPYTVIVKENTQSRASYEEGYLRLFIRSSGADTERFVDLRYKPSTEQWFLWEFAGMLSGIRIPKSSDVWA